jgi:hypothetical protein
MKKILAILLAGMMTALHLLAAAAETHHRKQTTVQKQTTVLRTVLLRLKAQSLTTAISAMKVQTASL